LKMRPKSKTGQERPAAWDGAAPTSPDGLPDEDTATYQEITSRLEAFCRERGMKLSADRGPLLADLVQMRKLWGDYYCPCQPERSPETVCVCEAVKDGLVDVMGACFCGLIVG